jgi:hypothetical protein
VKPFHAVSHCDLARESDGVWPATTVYVSDGDTELLGDDAFNGSDLVWKRHLFVLHEVVHLYSRG